MSAPRVGDSAPDFDAIDDAGERVTLAHHRGRWLVLYFYPKDETRGCVAEACAFRDRFTEVAALGAAVVGVSRDSVESHRAFKARHALPFRLLSDPEGIVVRAYGANGLLGLVRRVSYLIDPEGVVRAVHRSELRPESHVAHMLERIPTFEVRSR